MSESTGQDVDGSIGSSEAVERGVLDDTITAFFTGLNTLIGTLLTLIDKISAALNGFLTVLGK